MPDAAAETIFRLGRIQENADYLLPILIFVILIWYFRRRLRIDTADLHRWKRIVLFALRCLAAAGLLLYYLQPQWSHLAGMSNTAVLVDTSASMGNKDAGNNTSRLEAVREFFNTSGFLETLSQRHTVKVYAFDSELRGIKPAGGGNSASNSVSNSAPDFGGAGGETTALGDALAEVFRKERGEPLAAVIVFSDGQQNAGQNIDASLETAANLRIPVYTAGVGKTELPASLRIGNIDVPERVFPNDAFRLTVPIFCENIPPDKFSVTLMDSTADNAAAAGNSVQIGEQTFDTGTESNGQSGVQRSVTFDVKLPAVGKHKLTVKINTARAVQTSADVEPVESTFEVNAVDRKDRILLFASAPSRDYQFICAQIDRDKTMSADVLPGWQKSAAVSQNADKILTTFPATRAEMSQYDVLMAFDADWRELSPQQIEVLEYWIARQGGGAVLIAGGIHQTDTVSGWLYDKIFEKVRALYPVEFFSNEASFDSKMFNGAKPQPFHLTKAGEAAVYLQPYSDPVQSRSFWNTFAGFYGCFAVKGVKPAATLLASASSPSSVLMAEQFYGSGRVLYIGSGELWRMRRSGEKVFEQITAKMIRYVSQGRLQRDSDRVSLTADKKRYSLGSAAQLRITANDAQLNPLTDPVLPIEVQMPSGTKRTAEATLDPNVPGVYQTFVPLTEEGAWMFQLSLSGGSAPITVTQTLQVQMSGLEQERPNRNELFLERLAKESGGTYFKTLDNLKSLPERIQIRSQKAVLDAAAEEHLYSYLLAVISAALLLEWLLRRLWTLA
ncbi:MAG: VWA domain-containing protein [Planctomycetaceae bacterium]|jgi:hypothetical protein|nr:VWA domain-containing protein [Planctomycetaceae bacterium]